MRPIVTLGICVRDCENSIKEAVQSVLNQDYQHELMEIVFVDDGSKDKTLAVIMDCISNIDVKSKLISGEWRGLGWARNTVVDNASGDYIIWVDGDMILPRDHVRKQVEFIQNDPKIGIAKARYGIYEGRNMVVALENLVFLVFDFKYEGKANPKVLGTGGSIYRTSAIKHVGGFDLRIAGTGEDMDIEHRIGNAGWLLYRGTPAVFYETYRKTWRDLWKEEFWHGHGVHYIFGKNKGQISLYRVNPLGAFLIGIWLSTVAYRLTRKKWVFLLPIQYTFQKIAWCLGFISGQIGIRIGYK